MRDEPQRVMDARNKFIRVIRLDDYDNPFTTWGVYGAAVGGCLSFEIAAEHHDGRLYVKTSLSLDIDWILKATDAEILEYVETEVAIANVRDA